MPSILPALSELARRASRRYRAPGLEPEDLEQEGQLALLLALPRYDPAHHGALEAYLTVSVRCRLYRLCRQAWKRASRQGPLPHDLAAPVSPDPAELAEARDLVARVIGSLTPLQRSVITLLAEGRSPRQIAADLGTTPNTVSVARHRAISRLKELTGQAERP